MILNMGDNGGNVGVNDVKHFINLKRWYSFKFVLKESVNGVRNEPELSKALIN